MSLPGSIKHWFSSAIVITGVLLNSSCRPEATRVAAVKTKAESIDLDRYRHEDVGAALEGKPWITHVEAIDLDRDGLMDVVACDAQKNTIVWLRQFPRGHFTESVLADNLAGPAHVAAYDIDGDGDLDLLVACMGQILPSNEKIGSVVILENTGGEHYTRHDIVTNTYRVTDVEAGDFNGDGKIDLAVAKFGYDQGEVTWMENRGNWEFVSHTLLSLPGSINVCVSDMNGDHTPDIVALVSQQYEEIYLFENDGKGTFESKVVFGSTNEDYGSSGISLCDLNHDGRPDILYTNGDGFDYAEPGSRPWHGLQWLENAGSGYFRFHRIGNMAGAYSPVGVDLEGKGTTDIVCVSGFNNWEDPKSMSLVAFMNDGHENFTPHILAYSPTHLITVAAADFDGNGKPVLVTGGFHAYPPWDRMSRIKLWHRQ